MKQLYTLLVLLLPVAGMAQFTYESAGESTQVAYLGKDLKYDLHVTNDDSLNPITVRWRITENNFVSSEWQDYVCDIICYTPSKRWNDLTLDADTTFPIIHHISMNEVHGMGTSTLCFFDPTDSANTVECITLTAYSTPMILDDTIEVSGTDYWVISGEAYTESGGNYSVYSDAYVLTAGSREYMVIDGVIYEYEDGVFVTYDDEMEVEAGGVNYHIINGYAFTKAGNQYTLVGTYKETTVQGVDAIIIEGDTFVMHSGSYAPLGLETTLTQGASLAQNSPNPFKGVSFIEYAHLGNNAELNIHDLTGKLVRSYSLNNSQGKLRVTDLEAGLYFYSLVSDGAVVDTKRMQVIE